jgi:predicted metal-binding protein
MVLFEVFGIIEEKKIKEEESSKRKTHDYTIELLYHFNCGECKGWWSYATTPGQPIIDQNSKCLKGDRLYLSDEIEMNCPHCGHLSLIDIKDGFFETLMPDEESGKKAQLELEELTELEKQELLVANQPSLSEMMQMYMPPGTDLKLPKQD